MTDRGAQAVIMLLVLILPVAALIRRRLPLAVLSKYAAIWVAIAAALYFAVLLFT